MKRTLEGTKLKRQHVSGFRARMATPGGQEVLNRRRAKGRHQIAVTGSKRAQLIRNIFLKRASNILEALFGCKIYWLLSLTAKKAAGKKLPERNFAH